MLLLACTRGGSTAASAPSEVERGGQLYVANCQTCHGGPTGGGMMDIPPPHNSNGHTWHHSDCQIVEIVLDGPGQMGEMMRRMMGAPGGAPQMPAFRGQLAEADVRAVLAFIRTWWTPEQQEWQARVTRQAC
ncbi:MAG: cytochrome c [Chloroflexi bacterium]|nr:cytochrome c [Chloroflexota bacterium]